MSTNDLSPRAPSSIEAGIRTCLYYPFFVFRDELWVKEALLYWDRVATIVPGHIDPGTLGGADFQQLRQTGLLETWSVDEMVRHEAATKALSLLDEGAESRFPQDGTFHIHFGKLTHLFVDGLRERGWEVTPDNDGFLVDQRAALLLLTVLAHALAETTGAVAATDQDQLARSYVDIGKSAEVDKAALSIIRQDLSIPAPDLRSVDLERWVAFRNRYLDDLLEYRETIVELGRDVAKAVDQDEVKAIAAKHRKRVGEFCASRKSVFRTLTPEITVSSLALVAEVGQSVPDPTVWTGLGIGGAVAGLAVGLRRMRHKSRHELSFLREVKKEFGNKRK